MRMLTNMNLRTIQLAMIEDAHLPGLFSFPVLISEEAGTFKVTIVKSFLAKMKRFDHLNVEGGRVNDLNPTMEAKLSWEFRKSDSSIEAETAIILE